LRWRLFERSLVEWTDGSKSMVKGVWKAHGVDGIQGRECILGGFSVGTE